MRSRSSDLRAYEETMTYIVIWGAVALISALTGGILAAMKNRDYSSWAAWCFVFPPFVLAILPTPKNSGPAPVRRRLGDDGDPDRSFL
jgi:hypothetical protein